MAVIPFEAISNNVSIHIVSRAHVIMINGCLHFYLKLFFSWYCLDRIKLMWLLNIKDTVNYFNMHCDFEQSLLKCIFLNFHRVLEKNWRVFKTKTQ